MDQETALGILKSGHNVLLTGSAGTGKTHVLKQFIEHLQKHQVQVGVTASTGLAATHLNGTTIHSWAKIGIKHYLARGFANKIAEKERQRMKLTDVLIIDEISMLHDYRLDMVDDVLRAVREDERPFGGVQVVLCGDFFQLPPINRSDDERTGGFIVESNAWQNADFVVCYLTKSYRQSEDDAFSEILDAMRASDVRRRHAESLLARMNVQLPSGIVPTRLFPTNIDTDRLNQQQLNALPGEAKTYEMHTSGRKDKLEILMRSCLAEQTLKLKLGAQVMFIKNNPSKGYHNGTLGVVVDFSDGILELPIVKTTSGRKIVVSPEDWELRDDNKTKPKASVSQLPLKLAWAITIHKSQGMTLDAAEIDLSKTFVAGMGYVALSRVRKLEHLRLLGINMTALQVSEIAKKIDASLRKRSVEAQQKSNLLIDSKWLPYELHEIKPVKKETKPTSDFGERLKEMRKTYPNAFKQWKPETVDELQKLFKSGTTDIDELCSHFGRQPGGITFQLQKLGLIEQ